MDRIRAISLDLDDTLWAVGPVIRRAEAELWAWLGEHYPRIHERFTPEIAFELRQQVAAEYPQKAHDFRFLRKRVLADMARRSGYAEDIAHAAFEIFDRARNRVELFPDVEPALVALATRYSVVAVTNGNACLTRIGIDHYFSGIVSAAETGYAKPARQIFEVAVARAGVDPDEVLHVGDHPEYDVAGAADAGLRTAWINRDGADWPDHLDRPDVTVTSMTDLNELLGAAGRPLDKGEGG
jgi:putative hydrolase of the HAD superfamily